LLQCAPDGEKRFASGVELYNNGRIPEAVNEFEAGIMAFVSIKSFSDPNIISCDNALYIRDAEIIKIIYPVKVKIKTTRDYNIVSFDPVLYRSAVTNSADIKIYDGEGSLKKIISPLENKNKNIKSVLLDNNSIIYFIDSIIYTCNIDTGEAMTVTGQKFDCPFADTFYSVKFYLSGKSLAAVIGMAGVYNLSIIDLDKNAVLIKNKEIASSKLFFSGDDIYYIIGKSGSWTLNHLSIKKNITVRISDFSDLVDVEFSNAGIMFENKLGVWFLKYDGDKPDNLPFRYELAGGCGGRSLLKYKDDSYAADMKIFQEKIDYLKNAAPQIFIKKDEMEPSHR
jgi:hypothetical protein